MLSLIVTAGVNDVDPRAWLATANVLVHIADHPAHKVDDLLPWCRQSRSWCEAA
jgi:hypothetical protein